MRHLPGLFRLFPVIACAACVEEHPPTAPTSAREPGDPAYSHAAGHLVVNSAADPGDGTCNPRECTLREAIEDASSTEISFASGLAGPITLARPSAGGGSLVIDKDLTITGPSARMVIRRRPTDPAFRILRVGSGGDDVRLANLVLRNGKTASSPATRAAKGPASSTLNLSPSG